MGLLVHGTPVNGTNNSGASTTVSASITTTAPDTIIVAVISNYDQIAGGTLKTVTGVSGGGLTWAKRSAQSATANVTSIINVGLEVWWAHATGTLTAQSITATFNAAPNQFCDIMLFAVTGSNFLSAPWDTNASLPATMSSAGSALTTPTKGVTVDKTGDMLLGFLAYVFNGNPVSTSGTGFTDILPGTTTSLRNNWEQQVTVASGAKTINFNNDQNFMVLAADALSGAAASGTTGTIRTSLTKASLSAAGWTTIAGAIATTRVKASQSLSGNVVGNRASIVTRLPPVSLSAVALEKFIGQATTRLGNESGKMTANVVQALEIIQGPIVTALPPATPRILAAQLGTPGAGKSFSWRSTDA